MTGSRWGRRVARGAAAGAVLVIALVSVAAPASADAVRDRQWHLRYLDIAQVHAVSQGRGVTVAVIDSGVDADHPDLAGNVAPGTEYLTVNGRPAQAGNGWTDTDGHGTGMAALIAAHGRGPGRTDGVLGIAPQATVLPVKGESTFTGDTFRWTADRGAGVINVSLAGLGGPDAQRGVQYALDNDVVVVAAAGNTGEGDRRVQAPARFPGVVAVSGIDRQGRFTPASVQGPEVVLSAPAVDIVSAATGQPGRYVKGTGTSSATAIVSGVAALVRAKFPHLDAANVIHRLIATADDAGPKGRDPQYGYGIVNPYRALTADVPTVTGNPLVRPTTAATGPRPDGEPTRRAAGTDGGSSAALVAVLVGVLLALIAVGAFALLPGRDSRRGR